MFSKNLLNVYITGSGNIAHALLCELSRNKNFKTTIVTRKFSCWQSSLKNISSDVDVSIFPYSITSDVSKYINADIIILCLPVNLRNEYLLKIRQYVKSDCLLIAMPSLAGINFLFENLFPNNPYICLQRVPYISRIVEYGSIVNYEVKKQIEVYYSSNIKNIHKNILKNMFSVQIKTLSTFWTLLLSNSNPIIHIARICELMKEQEEFTEKILFYEKWGGYASELAINMDNELSSIFNGLHMMEYVDILKHYDVSNADELTYKINNIESFKGILAPMCKVDNYYIFDKNSRYFVEDLIYGTCFIKYVAQRLKIPTPNIDFAIKQVQELLNLRLIQNNEFQVSNWLTCLGYDILETLDSKILIQNV